MDAKHERKCWDCGNVAMHESRITPGVLCSECGSQDTRANKLPKLTGPTQRQIDSACLSVRHDFGLMGTAEKDAMRFEAFEWYRAWQKEGVMKADPDLLAACRQLMQEIADGETSVYEETGTACGLIEAAIAKVTGE